MPERKRQPVELPARPFLYTVDQIAGLLGVGEASVRDRYLFYVSNEWGRQSPDLLAARNIAPPGHPPEWRVQEAELVRWFKRKGFRTYARGVV
jgi:hypothetical protein